MMIRQVRCFGSDCEIIKLVLVIEVKLFCDLVLFALKGTKCASKMLNFGETPFRYSIFISGIDGLFISASIFLKKSFGI